MPAIVRPKIPLLTVFSGLWAGMPLRLVPQSPDTEPRISAAPVPTGRQSRVPGVPAISAPGSRTATPDTTRGGARCGTPRTHGDQRGPSARTGVTTPPAAVWAPSCSSRSARWARPCRRSRRPSRYAGTARSGRHACAGRWTPGRTPASGEARPSRSGAPCARGRRRADFPRTVPARWLEFHRMTLLLKCEGARREPTGGPVSEGNLIMTTARRCGRRPSAAARLQGGVLAHTGPAARRASAHPAQARRPR